MRRRQLTVRTLLAGMCLTQADGRPAHLTRVHQALTSLPEDQQRRLGVLADWKHGPHLLTYRQTEYAFALAAAALGKDEPDGLPSGPPQRVCDDLLKAGIAEEFKNGSRSLAVDWTDLESFSGPRRAAPATAPIPRRPGAIARTTCCAARTSSSTAITCPPGSWCPRRTAGRPRICIRRRRRMASPRTCLQPGGGIHICLRRRTCDAGMDAALSKRRLFFARILGRLPCCGTAATNVYRRPSAAANANVRSANVNSPGPVQMTAAGSRGYDQTPANLAGNPAGVARANAVYASAGRPPAPSAQWQPYSLPNVYYAAPDGNVYRQGNDGWQQQSGGNWGSASSDTTWADQEANARNNNNTPVAAASYSMSNADRFTGAPNSGWNAQDRGDGGYSRTLGGTGGISSEYYNYWNDVQDNAVAMWWNGGYTYTAGNWYYGGLGWGARFPDGSRRQVTAARRPKRASRHSPLVQHLPQVFHRVPDVDEARVERREAEAQDVGRAEVADDAAGDQRLHDRVAAVRVRKADLAAAQPCSRGVSSTRPRSAQRDRPAR